MSAATRPIGVCVLPLRSVAKSQVLYVTLLQHPELKNKSIPIAKEHILASQWKVIQTDKALGNMPAIRIQYLLPVAGCSRVSGLQGLRPSPHIPGRLPWQPQGGEKPLSSTSNANHPPNADMIRLCAHCIFCSTCMQQRFCVKLQRMAMMGATCMFLSTDISSISCTSLFMITH